jgi:peptidoglycan-associated lipoprotein
VTSPATDNKIEVNPLKDPNNILSKRSVYFDFDKYAVKPEYRALVEAHAKYLASHPELSIRIEGNADDRGSREYNLSLGQKRAVAVKSAANLLGVPDKQLETISYGEEKPKATGDDEASWSENRRADIVYSGE